MPGEEIVPGRRYWDACVFLSAINEVPDRLPAIRELMRSATENDVEIFTSTLTIAEVAFAAVEQTQAALDLAIERKIDQLWIRPSPVKIVDVHQLVVRRARSLMRRAIEREWSLKAGDAVHLATAEIIRAERFETYDEKLDKFQEICRFSVGRPRPLQDPLL